MKRWIIIGMFLLGVVAVNAQEKLAFSKVIKADSVSTEGIFVSIKEWLSMEFKKGNNAIELEDKKAGLLIANASSNYKSLTNGIMYAWSSGSIEYIINIQIREGRFKVTLTNFILKCPNKGGEKLGILTSAEESTYKGWEKKHYNKVWKDLKIKSKDIADQWFALFETINFSNYKQDTSEDW